MREVRLHGKWAAEYPVALVDDEDYELVSRYRWMVHHPISVNSPRRSGPYARATSAGRPMMHVLLCGRNGIDHQNGNGLDNRRKNLRPCSGAENSRNRRSWGRSKYLGVHLDRGRWRAVIEHDGRRQHLGMFANEADAARAYDKAAAGLFGEFARLNFPEADRG